MKSKQKSKLTKVLFIIILTIITSATLPAFLASNTFSSTLNKLRDYDSTRVILFLDTTILGQFFFPVAGKVISPFGSRGHRQHTGTDIKLLHGDTVKAAFSGVVTKADPSRGYGILVVLQHPGNLETYYAHLSKALVKYGDTIKSGTPLGLGGRTGRATTDHLHFEIRQQGKSLDAERFFSFNDHQIKTLVLLRETGAEKEVFVAENVKVRGFNASPQEEVNSVIAAEKKYYTIKKGDTLYSISKRYGTTVEEICRLNHIKKPNSLKVGKKIRII